MMDQLVQKFPDQIREAIAIGRAAQIRPHDHEIQHVYVAGMGGSGIGANFVAAFIKDECQVPYTIGKGYQVPGHIGKNTLAIASSYSGNTEETLSAFEQIGQTGAKMVVIASGGKLIDRAKAQQLDYVQLPSGWPSPRACLGYSLVQQLFILYKLGMISDQKIGQVDKAAQLMAQEESQIKSEAMSIANFLLDKIPVLYTTGRMEPVAVRLRQQINENAKMLCWHHVIPEMNHNELVGWRQENESLAVLFLRNHDDYDRNQTRIRINKEIIEGYTPSVRDVYSKGDSLVEQALYLVHLGDWVSVYLAQLKGIDAVEIKVIDYLKKELGKV